MSNTALMKRRAQMAAKLDEDRLIERLTPQQQKYAQHAVLTNMTDKDLATRLSVSSYMIRKWKNDPLVQRYIKVLQKKVVDDGFMDKVRANNQLLYSKIVSEMDDRFRSPDPDNELDPDATFEERQMYLKRFATNADFKDLARVLDQFDKRVRLDTEGAPTERVEGSDLREKMQERFMRIQTRRKRLNHELEKEGLDFSPEAHVEASEEMPDGSSRPIKAELLDEEESESAYEEEIILEEYSILRNVNDDRQD